MIAIAPHSKAHIGRTAVAAALTLMTLIGCAAEKWVEVFPVSGTVKVDGKAPEGAQVVFHLVNATSGDGVAVAPTGTVKSDGTFVVSSYKAGDGAAPGEYVVTIQWFKFDEKIGGLGPNVLPPTYADAKTSPLKATVSAGGPTQLQSIAISGSAKTASAASPGARR